MLYITTGSGRWRSRDCIICTMYKSEFQVHLTLKNTSLYLPREDTILIDNTLAHKRIPRRETSDNLTCRDNIGHFKKGKDAKKEAG